jgi:hypothetical protein
MRWVSGEREGVAGANADSSAALRNDKKRGAVESPKAEDGLVIPGRINSLYSGYQVQPENIQLFLA